MPFEKGKSGNEETKFGNSQDPTRGGRPKKLETLIQEHFLGEHNIRLSKTQTAQIILSFLSKSKKEILQLAANDEMPFWIEMLVEKSKKDLRKGSIELVEKLWDRVYGKPNQTEEKETELKVPPIDMEKRQNVLDNLLQQTRDEKAKGKDKENKK